MKRVMQFKAKLLFSLGILGMLGVGSFTFAPVASAMAPGQVSLPVPVVAATNCPTLGSLHNTGSGKGSPGLNCFINKYVNPFVKFLAAVTAVFVVISIVIGGIQYSMSADDPGKVTAAKKRIFDAFIALLAFLFMMAFLTWIIPGGP